MALHARPLTHHPQVGWRAAPLEPMPSTRRLTALALARAMLAGPAKPDGLAARMHACLDAQPAWCKALAERCAALPGERWRRLTVRSLAALIERDAGYLQAWQLDPQPLVRRQILREREGMQPPPLALESRPRPHWPHSGALAQWLGLSTGAMWRLTRSAEWQRRAPLAEQHHRYLLRPKRSGGWRLFEIPAGYLMTLQRRLLAEVLDHLPPHEAACGFVRGRSLLDHAGAHSGQAVVLQFDLRDFFTSVRASRVHALFATLGYPDTVATDLTALVTTSTPEPVLRRMHEHGQLPWPQLQRLRGPRLAQGAPTSARASAADRRRDREPPSEPAASGLRPPEGIAPSLRDRRRRGAEPGRPAALARVPARAGGVGRPDQPGEDPAAAALARADRLGTLKLTAVRSRRSSCALRRCRRAPPARARRCRNPGSGR